MFASKTEWQGVSKDVKGLSSIWKPAIDRVEGRALSNVPTQMETRVFMVSHVEVLFPVGVKEVDLGDRVRLVISTKGESPIDLHATGSNGDVLSVIGEHVIVVEIVWSVGKRVSVAKGTHPISVEEAFAGMSDRGKEKVKTALRSLYEKWDHSNSSSWPELKAIRIALGFSQTASAGFIGVAVRTICRWEKQTEGSIRGLHRCKFHEIYDPLLMES